MSKHAAPPRMTARKALKVIVEVVLTLPTTPGRRAAR